MKSGLKVLFVIDSEDFIDPMGPAYLLAAAKKAGHHGDVLILGNSQSPFEEGEVGIFIELTRQTLFKRILFMKKQTKTWNWMECKHSPAMIEFLFVFSDKRRSFFAKIGLKKR